LGPSVPGYVAAMSKPPPSFWQDPEGDGVEVAPAETPDAADEPDAGREPEVVPADVGADDTETEDLEGPR
jgi:hypothetical protein